MEFCFVKLQNISKMFSPWCCDPLQRGSKRTRLYNNNWFCQSEQIDLCTQIGMQLSLFGIDCLFLFLPQEVSDDTTISNKGLLTSNSATSTDGLGDGKRALKTSETLLVAGNALSKTNSTSFAPTVPDATASIHAPPERIIGWGAMLGKVALVTNTPYFRTAVAMGELHK